MIVLERVWDSPIINGRRSAILCDASLVIPHARYALLSSEGAFRRHAIDILAGLRPPLQGAVLRDGRCSWPIGRAGFIRGALTGYEIANLITRLYSLDRALAWSVLEELLSDPAALALPVNTWSPIMRQEFGLAVALLPQFDIYFFEGVFPSQNPRFLRVWRVLMEQRLHGRTLIMATTRVAEAEEFCDRALIVDNHRIYLDDDMDQALANFPLQPGNELNERDRASNTSGIDDVL